MEVHRKKLSENITIYYFTKNRNQCLMIEYNKQWSFGEHDASGTTFDNVRIHYQNSWIKKDLEKISLADVPKVIIDTLTYLA